MLDEVLLLGIAGEQHSREEGTDDGRQSDLLRQPGEEQTDDDGDRQCIGGTEGLLALVVVGGPAPVEQRDAVLREEDDSDDENTGDDGHHDDAHDVDAAAGACGTLDDGEDDHSEHIVDDGGRDDDPGLLGIHQVHVLDHTRGDSHAGGNHGRRQEHGVVEVAVGELDERESQDEGDDDSEDGHEHGGLAGAEKVLDLGLETHREQEEYNSQLGEGVEDRVTRILGVPEIHVEKAQKGGVADGQVGHDDTDHDLSDESGEAEFLDYAGADTMPAPIRARRNSTSSIIRIVPSSMSPPIYTNLKNVWHGDGTKVKKKRPPKGPRGFSRAVP